MYSAFVVVATAKEAISIAAIVGVRISSVAAMASAKAGTVVRTLSNRVVDDIVSCL
jgi:hypothetical protein